MSHHPERQPVSFLELVRLSLYMSRLEETARAIMARDGLPALLAWGVVFRALAERYAQQAPAETESDMATMTLDHPEVRTARMTCEACPEQWEGTLSGDRPFYFRYRWGRATLAVAPAGSPRSMVDGVTMPGQADGVLVAVVPYGDRLDGWFNTEEERLIVLSELLDIIEAMQ